MSDDLTTLSPPPECLPPTQDGTAQGPSHHGGCITEPECQEFDTRVSINRLTDAQKAQILRLHSENLTQMQIAEIVKCSQATVSRALSYFEDTTVAAVARAKAASLEVVDATITSAKKGSGTSQKLALQVAGLIGQDETGTVKVAIGIGMPGQSAPAPDFTVDAEVQSGE